MDPAPPPDATHDAPMTTPEPPAPAAIDAHADVPKVPKEKKPRPVTYRIYPADRPRLDAFRTDPKQSQADNLQGVIDLLENASAAIREQEQVQTQLQETQTQLQVAQARAAQAEAERDQARQEVEAARGQREARAEELRQLQQTLAQERARAAAAAPTATSPVGQAVLARELLAMATEAGCPPALQTRLIALATQALGGQSSLGSPEKRQDAAELPGTTRSPGGPRKAPRPTVDPARFGPLFAGAMAIHPVTDAGGTNDPPGPAGGKSAAVPNQPTEAAASVGGVATTPSEPPADDAQQPPGAVESPLAPSTAPRPAQRRGGAAEKLERALLAVLAHNEAQTSRKKTSRKKTSREKKWAVTESALARLTGCFRPAVRTFFAGRAEEIEAHNQKHHLLPGLNAARGKRGETIEVEVRWRGTEGAASTQPTGDQGAGGSDNAQAEDADETGEK